MNSKNRFVGLYVHIPFCLQKCRYCDFCSFPGVDAQTVHTYVSRLCEELSACAVRCRDRTVDTVYFGGGTPTLLPVPEFVRVLETVWRCFRIAENAEVTAECNPATGTGAILSALYQSGVNRLSIGAQSTSDEELKTLGRVHTAKDVLRTYDAARRAGFQNISLDLMFGLPGQTLQTFRRSLHDVAALYPEHLSVYGLIVEQGTPFGAMQEAGTLCLPEEDTERAMYAEALSVLESRGWKRYEISNFARPGRESRHNLRYWNCDEYIGCGTAAHSYFAGERYAHSRDLDAYLRGEDTVTERTYLSEHDCRDEYVMLQMRLTHGVCEKEYAERFGESFAAHYGVRLKAYERMGFVHRENGRWFFSDEGFSVSNTVLADILDL